MTKISYSGAACFKYATNFKIVWVVITLWMEASNGIAAFSKHDIFIG